MENRTWFIQIIQHGKQGTIFRQHSKPTAVPLFAKSMAILEPKIINRDLHVPMLIFDPTCKKDIQPFEQQNAALQKEHSHLINHRIYSNSGHNVHFERKIEFLKHLASFLNKVKEQAPVALMSIFIILFSNVA